MGSSGQCPAGECFQLTLFWQPFSLSAPVSCVTNTRIQKYSMDYYVIQHLPFHFLTSDVAVLYLYQYRYHNLRIRGTVISQTLLPVQPVHQASGKCV